MTAIPADSPDADDWRFIAPLEAVDLYDKWAAGQIPSIPLPDIDPSLPAGRYQEQLRARADLEWAATEVAAGRNPFTMISERATAPEPTPAPVARLRTLPAPIERPPASMLRYMWPLAAMFIIVVLTVLAGYAVGH